MHDNTADYEEQYRNAAGVLVNNKVQECEFERNAGGDRVAMEVNKRVESVGWVCNITDTPTETNKEQEYFNVLTGYYATYYFQELIALQT